MRRAHRLSRPGQPAASTRGRAVGGAAGALGGAAAAPDAAEQPGSPRSPPRPAREGRRGGHAARRGRWGAKGKRLRPGGADNVRRSTGSDAVTRHVVGHVDCARDSGCMMQLPLPRRHAAADRRPQGGRRGPRQPRARRHPLQQQVPRPVLCHVPPQRGARRPRRRPAAASAPPQSWRPCASSWRWGTSGCRTACTSWRPPTCLVPEHAPDGPARRPQHAGSVPVTKKGTLAAFLLIVTALSMF